MPYKSEKIAPTGSSVAVFNLGDPLRIKTSHSLNNELLSTSGFLTGPHDQPITNEPLGETYAVGIVAKPVGTYSLFGIPPIHIRASVLSLCDIWAEYDDFQQQLLKLESPDIIVDAVSSWTIEHLIQPPSNLNRYSLIASALEDNPNMPIADLAKQFNLSMEHLSREFAANTGLTPRAYSRILKLRNILKNTDIQSEVNWVDIAISNGWYDQSHFIRDFKRYTGVTPTEYRKTQLSTYSEEELKSSAGFTPTA